MWSQPSTSTSSYFIPSMVHLFYLFYFRNKKITIIIYDLVLVLYTHVCELCLHQYMFVPDSPNSIFKEMMMDLQLPTTSPLQHLLSIFIGEYIDVVIGSYWLVTGYVQYSVPSRRIYFWCVTFKSYSSTGSIHILNLFFFYR